MKTYMVDYTLDGGTTKETILISAADYSKAYLAVCYKLPPHAVIIEVFEII